MQLHGCQQQLQLARPAAHAPALAVRQAKRLPQPRLSSVIVAYKSYDEAGPSTAEVTAEDTYRAAALNMPEGAWAGRWERWAPPADGLPGSASLADETRGWQLLTSGQTAYTVKASESTTEVSTADAPDSPPLSLAQASAQAATAAVLGVEQGDMQASLRTGPLGGSNVLRDQHSFNKDDHLFRPYLPDRTQPGGDTGLRLWAADGLGFVLAPTSLPLSTLHTQPWGSSAGAASAASGKEVPPFVANIYIKHPSHQPGVGRRWGWDLAFDAAPAAAAGAAGALQYIHHTSLGPVDAQQSGGGPEALLRPELHTRPPTAPRPLPPSLASFMASEGHHWLRMNGSAVDFTYDSGRLTRTDTGSISWHGSPGSSSCVEVWYSSGAYTRTPVFLQSQLLAGGPVVLEAGALIYRDASLSAPVEGVARWLLTYRSGDGALDSVRLEVYRTAAE